MEDIRMALRTRQEYISALKKMRPNIYKFGELIADVTTHPATRRMVESHAVGIDAAHNPELAHVFTTTSHLTGERIHRFNSAMISAEDMMYNSFFKRKMYQLTGTCHGGLCAGWHGYSVMWSVTYDMDQALGTDYHERLKEWGRHFERKGLVTAAALTDAKGDRTKKPSQQEYLDSNLHIVDYRNDGIIIRGTKSMICGSAAADEIMLLPGSAYREEDKNFCQVCVVPKDIEGLTIVECRHPNDSRDLEEGFDNPVHTGITQAYLLFDDVFVPRDRVFMAGEYQFTGQMIRRFTSSYRACIGACVCGQGDVMVGAAALIARANGIGIKAFRDKITEMVLRNETTFSMGLGAIALGHQHPSGAWICDDLRGHANKIWVGTLPYENKRLLQEIAGGIGETGCFPSYKDIENHQYGHLIKAALKAGASSGVSRARISRLIEWLTLGAGIPGCMHGGGSPDGARMVLYHMSPLEEYVDYAKALAGVDEDISEPVKKK